MAATKAFLLAAAQAIGADSLTLNQGDGNVISLAKNEFTPGPNLTLADLVEADFDGYAALSSSTDPTVALDPATQDYRIRIPDPAGGWRWVTTGVTNLNQTIYGWFLTGQDSGALWDAVRLQTPIILTGVGQEVVLGDIAMTLPPGFVQ